MYRERRVVITGIGPITSIGIGREALWRGVLEKRVNVKLEKFFVDEELWDSFHVHRVEGFDITKFGISKEALDYIKDWKEGDEVIDLYYLLAAVKLALDDSKLNYDVEDNEDNNVGLVLAHENLNLMPFVVKISERAFELLGDKSRRMTRRQFYEGLYRHCLKSGYDVQSYMTLFHVARTFKVHEHSLFINNACASGLYAIETASEMIKSGQNSIVVVATSDYLDFYKLLWFKDLGIYSEDGKVKPFGKDSNGLVCGDGGVGLVVEDLEHAQKRNAPIYGEYLGGGFCLESWKVTTPQIGRNFYQKAILKALDQSNIDKENIDLLCPHGVGVQPIDYYESKAITDIFGLNPKRPLISTFKPYVGHNLGGSTLMEAAILLLSLSNNLIPPTLNCENIDPKFDITLVKEKVATKLNIVLKICCAFAGYNAAVIFKKLG